MYCGWLGGALWADIKRQQRRGAHTQTFFTRRRIDFTRTPLCSTSSIDLKCDHTIKSQGVTTQGCPLMSCVCAWQGQTESCNKQQPSTKKIRRTRHTPEKQKGDPQSTRVERRETRNEYLTVMHFLLPRQLMSASFSSLTGKKK